jgi:proline-serine-threonine phosphatase interacting protein 1
MLTLNLWEYTNLFSVNLLDQDESFERVRQSLEQCQIQGEIETFISEKGTSQEPPGISLAI